MSADDVMRLVEKFVEHRYQKDWNALELAVRELDGERASCVDAECQRLRADTYAAQEAHERCKSENVALRRNTVRMKARLARFMKKWTCPDEIMNVALQVANDNTARLLGERDSARRLLAEAVRATTTAKWLIPVDSNDGRWERWLEESRAILASDADPDL